MCGPTPESESESGPMGLKTDLVYLMLTWRLQLTVIHTTKKGVMLIVSMIIKPTVSNIYSLQYTTITRMAGWQY